MKRFLPKLAFLALLLFCCVYAKAQFGGDLAPCPGVVKKYTYKASAYIGSVSFNIISGSPGSLVSVSGSVPNGDVMPDHVTAFCNINWQNLYASSGDAQAPSKLVVNLILADGSSKHDTLSVKPKVIPSDFAKYINNPPIETPLPCDFRGPLQFGISMSLMPNSSGATGTASFDAASGWTVAQVPGSNLGFQYNVTNGNKALLTVNLTSSCNITYSYKDSILRSGPSGYSGTITAPGIPPTVGFCNSAVITFYAPKYASAASYTWTADDYNILINGQHSPVTVTGAVDTSVTIEQADKTLSGYYATVSVHPNLDPSLGCVGGTVSTLSKQFWIGGNPVLPPTVLYTGTRVSMTMPNISGATQYTWFMDGTVLGTTTTPRYQFSYTSDCNTHSFQAYVDRSTCGTAASAEVEYELCGSGISVVPTGAGKADIGVSHGAIKNVKATVGLIVAPNPTAGHLNVSIPAQYLDGFIQVFDAHGSLIKISKAVSANMYIDLSHLPAGVYIISLEKGILDKQTTKIVKQ